METDVDVKEFLIIDDSSINLFTRQICASGHELAVVTDDRTTCSEVVEEFAA
jgi:hypothetical protein